MVSKFFFGLSVNFLVMFVEFGLLGSRFVVTVCRKFHWVLCNNVSRIGLILYYPFNLVSSP